MYEEDLQWKKAYHAHLNQWFEKYRCEKNPLLNFTCNYLTGGSEDQDHSAFFLMDALPDPVDWRIDNGRKEDLKVVRKPIPEKLQANEL